MKVNAALDRRAMDHNFPWKRRRGQFDDQLISRASGPPLEDVYADQVAPDLTDLTGHRSQGTGAVR